MLKSRFKRLLLAVTPAVLGVAIITPGVKAATSATSSGFFQFNNFSHSPIDVKTETDTNTLTTAEDGTAEATGSANAFITSDPPEGANLVESSAIGEGADYYGLAKSQSTILGVFQVGAGESFRFDFSGLFNLAAKSDDSTAEKASAWGKIMFDLFDTTNPLKPVFLDSFGLFGKVNTANDNDKLDFYRTASVVLDPLQTVLTSQFGGSEETASASIAGLFERTFNRNITITLLEGKYGRAEVASLPPVIRPVPLPGAPGGQPGEAAVVPEPSEILGAIGSLGVLVFLRKKLKQQQKAA